MESILLCIQIVLFHLSECFSYLNTPWSQHVRISDYLTVLAKIITHSDILPCQVDIWSKQLFSWMLQAIHADQEKSFRKRRNVTSQYM